MTMKKIKVFMCVVASVTIVALNGCSSGGGYTTADVMRGHAKEDQSQVDLQNQIAKDWEKGAKMVSTGEARVKDGQTLIQKAENDGVTGRAEVEKGNNEIAEGNRLMQESKRRYSELFPNLELKGTK
jgi:hypothetical protein